MSWNGSQGKGAGKARRIERREQAEIRNNDCPDTRRRRFRLRALQLDEGVPHGLAENAA